MLSQLAATGPGLMTGLQERSGMGVPPRIRHNGEPGEVPGREEISSATDVLLAMVKATKGLRMYLPNNPVLIRFVEELNEKMTAHIGRFGGLRLDVEPFALRYKGAEVYENPDPKDSLAFRIHSDGIRELTFSRGLEQRELKSFLGIVAFEQHAHLDDDIVTQLWERDLPHISYVLEDDLVETIEEEEPAGGSQQAAISRIHESLSAAPPLPPRAIPKHLLMLSKDDVDWLRKVRQSEVHRNPLEDVFHILFAILAGIRQRETFGDFIDISAHLIRNMLVIGELGHVLTLVRFLDALRKREGISPEQREAIKVAIDGTLADGMVQVLQESIDSAESIDYQEVRELLLILGLPSLEYICELLGRVEKLKMRKVIVEVLVELGQNRPEVFTPFLSDQRWYLVRNVVLVLSLLGTPKALEMIVGLISHKEQRIRREVLGFLERSPDPKAKPYIVRYLRDEVSSLRIRALQILARERLAFALKPIISLIAAEDFKDRELEEKKAVYEAVGELGGSRVLPIFREMLLKRRWFQKAAQKEMVILAVAGLMKTGTPAAVELLQEARNQRNPETRAIVEQAITAMAGQERGAAAGGEH